MFNVAENSLLSCYQRDLYQRYGIFGIQSTEETLEELAAKYIKTSFGGDGESDRMGIVLETVTVDGSAYSLYSGTLLKANMAECMKRKLPLAIADWLGFRDALRQLLAGETGRDAETETGGSGSEEGREESAEETWSRTLENKTILELLPSSRREAEKTGLEFQLPSNLDELIQNGTEEILSTLYILEYFGTYTDPKPESDSFFHNEVEYVLAGNTGDDANLQEVKAYLILLRTGLNSLHIAEDPLKLEAAFALAAAISGPGALWTQAAVVAAWAAAEAVLDVEFLLSGKTVPFWKTAADWNLSIEGLSQLLLEGTEPSGTDSGNGSETEEVGTKGLDYNAYLALLLFLTGSEKKITRVMDLIQINLCGTSDRGFDLSRCYGGFRICCDWRQTKLALLPMGNKRRTYEQIRTYF